MVACLVWVKDLDCPLSAAALERAQAMRWMPSSGKQVCFGCYGAFTIIALASEVPPQVLLVGKAQAFIQALQGRKDM